MGKEVRQVTFAEILAESHQRRARVGRLSPQDREAYEQAQARERAETEQLLKDMGAMGVLNNLDEEEW